jgi:hypothetical protein
MIETAKIVNVLSKRVWAEKDFMGTVHIKMQHEGHDAFDLSRSSTTTRIPATAISTI